MRPRNAPLRGLREALRALIETLRGLNETLRGPAEAMGARNEALSARREPLGVPNEPLGVPIARRQAPMRANREPDSSSASSSRPVEGAFFLVRDRQDEEAFLFNAINNAVGKNRNTDSPGIRENRHPRQWMTTDTTDRGLYDVKEGPIQAIGPLPVEILSLEEFPLCKGMPRCPDQRSLARASLKTASES